MEVKKIALNLSLPAKKIESSKLIPSLRFELNFDINNFKKFKDKIIYIVVDKQPDNIQNLSENDSKDKSGEKLILNGMARDYFQRENLVKGLTELSEEGIEFLPFTIDHEYKHNDPRNS